MAFASLVRSRPVGGPESSAADRLVLAVRLTIALVLAALLTPARAQDPTQNSAQGPRQLIEQFLEASSQGADLLPFLEAGPDPARDLKLAYVLAQELAEKKKVTDKAFLAIPERIEESVYPSPLSTSVPFAITRESSGQWLIKVIPPADPLPLSDSPPPGIPTAVKWPLVGLLALAGIALAWIVQLPLRRLLKPVQDWDGSKLTTKGRRYLAWGIGLAVASQTLHWAVTLLPDVGPLDDHFFLVLRTLTAVGSVLAGWGLWDLLCGLAGEKVDRKGGPGSKLLVPVMKKFGQAIIFLTVLYLLLTALGFNATGMVAGLGLTGALTALAAKDSVENFFGTLTILFERPFIIGDWIKVGDVEGIVEEIGLRTTKIRSFGDSVISLPNIRVVAQPVENMGRRRMRPFKQSFAVIASHPEAEAFADSIRDWVKHHPQIVEDRSHAALAGLDAGRPQVTLSVFLDVDSYAEELKLKEEITLNLLRLAREAGVKLSGEIPEP